MRQSLAPRLIFALLAAWAVFLIARAAPHYLPDLGFLRALLLRFVKEKTPQAGVVYALHHHLEMLLKTGLLHLVLAGFGAAVVGWLVPGGAAGLLLPWGVGFGAAGLATLGWGLAGLMYPGTVLVSSVALAAAAWGTRHGEGLRRAVRDLPGAVARSLAGVPWWYPVTGGLALASLVAMAMPPDSSWDAVVYHLRVPSFFVEEHRIFHVPTHHFTAFPLGTEMHYAWLMLLGGLDRMGGGEAARVFHVSCALLGAVCAGRLARGLAGASAGWLAGALVLLCPIAGSIAVRAYNDFSQAALAGIALVLWLERPRGAGVIAGAVVGAALAAKYTAVIPFAVLAAAWFRLVPAPYLAVAAVLAPWGLKNLLLTGNPTAPLLGGLFPPAGPETAFQFSAYAGHVGGMSFSPAGVFDAVRVLFVPTPGETLSELLWVLVPAALLLPGAGRGLGLVGAALTAGWMILTPQLRFYMSVVPALAATASVGWSRIEAAASPRLLAVLGPALGVVMGLNLLRQPVEHIRLFDPLPFVLGRETAWDSAARSLYPAPYYGRIADWANRSLPRNARLLVMIDIKAHYIWRRTFHDFQYAQPGLFLRWLRGAGSVGGLVRKLREEGITHILVVRQRTRDVGNHYAWRGAELAEAAEFLAAHTAPVAKTDLVEILGVESRARPRRSLDEYRWILFTHPENLLIWTRDAEALALLEETERRAPWLRGVKPFLGMALVRGGRIAEGERMLAEGAREAGPDSAMAAFWLGQVFQYRGDRSGALRAWRESVRLDPRNAEVRYNLALLLHGLGQSAEALKQATEACRLDPGKSEYASARASIAAGMGRP
jgi:tetratricopeptide (TPR) repeat protein